MEKVAMRVTRSSLRHKEMTPFDKENASLLPVKKIKRDSKKDKVAEEQKYSESKKVEKRHEQKRHAKTVIRPRKHFTRHDFLIDDPPLTTQNPQRITRSYSLDSRKSKAPPSNDLADTFKSSLVLDKTDFCLASTEPYFTHGDTQTIHPLPPTETNTTQVELPSWRLLEIRPKAKKRKVKNKKQKMDPMIREDLDLEKRAKYHNKLELKEKRISVEFIRNRQKLEKRENEQKHQRKKIYEKYRRCVANGYEYVNSDPDIDMDDIIQEFDEDKIKLRQGKEKEKKMITKMNEEPKKIRIKENIPISVFGEGLPAFRNREFGINFHERPDSPKLPF